jgi:DHA1 family bicyclomycin/chloramphenicol resistance-like MFS transporter
VLLLWQSFRRLPETLPARERIAFSPSGLARSYWTVFTSLVFQMKAGALSFSFAGLFLYVAAAPVFLTQHLGLGPEQFAWQFVPTVAGIFFGALASNRFAGRMPVARHVGIAFGFMVGASAVNVLYHLALPPALPWSVLPLMFYAFGMAVAAPMVTLLVMDLYPGLRGLVASCQSFTQTMLAALVAGVVAPLLSPSVIWLAAGQLGCAVIGLLLWLTGRSYYAAQTRREANAWETIPVE